MNPQRSTRWHWIAATIAVTLGTAVAYYQSACGPEPERFEAPSSAKPQPGHPTPTPGPPSVPGREPRSSQPADGPGIATSPGDPEETAQRQPGTQRAGPKPTHLPEFFANALGNPAPGNLAEGTPHEMQARMDQEPRDEKWATNVEWQLENYLALRPFASQLGMRTVECRKTVCRVLATADKRALGAVREADWHEMMSALRYESVSNEFSSRAEMVVLNAADPDRVGFVTYFDRKD